MTTIAAITQGQGQTAALALAGICLGQFVLALDYSIVYLALPSMAKGLALDTALSQWIVSAYGLMFAGCLLTGGRVCDGIGASKAFAIAVCLFSAACLSEAAALTGPWLIAARGGQGIAAALLQPALLSLLARYFPSGPARAKALSIWGAVGASGLVAGVLLGGVLTLFSWRLVFFINVPIGMLCLWLLRRAVTQAAPLTHHARIPIISALSGTLAIISIVMWLTRLAQAGLDDAQTHAWAGAAAGLSAVFFTLEALGPRPLVSRGLRCLPGLRTGCWTSAFYMAGVGSAFFLLTLLLQNEYGANTLSAGLLFLPMAAMIILGNIVAGKLIGVMSAERVLCGGFALGAAGLWLLALSATEGAPGRLSADGAFNGLFWGGMLAGGLGHGIIYTANFVAGLKSVPENKQGAGSGLMVTAQYAGGAVALALAVILLGLYPGETGYFYAFILLACFSLAGAAAALLSAQE
ncbi:MFS transporter [Acerihabitans sp. KWT182]|uniref:MFS transporter n=1 Tax=Acerihabitans sp. KWT182 TaxID=3157919 RepID=A0AAU7QGT4_9GAMM